MTAKTAAIRSAATPKQPGFSVHTPGNTPITVRSAPDAATRAIGHRANGSRLSIICQTKGTKVHDTTTGHSSTLWDKLSTGGYVSNLYTHAYSPTTTGYTPGLKRCTSNTTTKPASRTTTTTTKARSTVATPSASATKAPSPAPGTPVGAAGTVTTKAP